MKKLFPLVLSLIFVTGTTSIFSIEKASADVAATAASLGGYIIYLSKNSGNKGNLLITQCLSEANRLPLFSVFCPFAFILNEEGKYVPHQSLYTYLRENGVTEDEIKLIEKEGSAGPQQ